MNLQERISAFAALGARLREILEEKHDSPAAAALSMLTRREHQFNGWFTEENIRHALSAWAAALNKADLEKWTARYELSREPMKTVAVIMAGNLPLVGFHDFLSVLLSGNRIVMKLASDDKHLMPALAALLTEIEPRFDEQIRIADGKLEKMDAVIATGSNNSTRYFEYYFSKYPNIIRGNRNSAAVLTGKETAAELEALGEDIFRYYGLGCRSVSKLFVPRYYDFANFFHAIFPWGERLMSSNKYMNNYDYNKAVYMLNKEPLLDNNFLLLKEDIGLASPAAVLFYEYYLSEEDLRERLRSDASQLQCLVGKKIGGAETVGFGQTQCPALWDYADGVDTLKFLSNI